MPDIKIEYAKPNVLIPGEAYFKWPAEHKFILTFDVDPSGPYELGNKIQGWLWDRSERTVGWRTPRGKTYHRLLVSIKDPDTALLFKLTWGGASHG